MAETRPTGEQLRFVSSATGEHILDTYLEAAEKGGRTLPDLLDDIFDSNGVFDTSNFQFRINSTTRAYQVRVGIFANANDGWVNIPNGFIFRQRGAYANTTAYEQLDVVTVSNTTYVCTVSHTSSTATPDLTKFAIIVDGTALNTATTSAQTSATNAATSATAAANSATAAASSQSAAATSASNASTSATTATTQAGISTTKATEAASSAAAALSSSNAAAASQSAAAASQSSAATSASAASASQTAAANSATSAASSASSATSSATSASNSASTATTKASESAASATLANDWATKTSSTVAGGEWSAKYHAQQAASSASSASTSASNAATSATSAASAQTAAEAARDATLASFDSFDDRYLGPKANDPTLDNDGNALIAGALYFNTTAGAMKVYTGSAWVAAYVSGTSFLPLVGGTLTGALVLPGDAVNALEAVPKQQLDAGLATKAATSHTHAISDVTNLQTSLDGKAASTHSHAISDITNLQTTLDGKQAAGSYAAATHTHAIADVTGLQTELDGKQAAGSYAAATHSHAIADVTGLQTALDGKQAAGSYAAATHSHAISDVTGLQTALDGKLATSGGTLTQVSQTIVAVAASAVDCSAGNYFTKTASGALTWTVTNVPSAKAYSFILELTNGGTGTQTWFSGIKWPGGTAPTLVASGVDVLGFITDDGGTTWRGVQLMKDSK